jgi:DNA-binding MarR family transcriptional regulator
MTLFSGLRKIREFERAQFPSLKSIVDFDIIIEIGYAEEKNQPLTVKQFFLLNICSRSTARRKLAVLVERGIVTRRKHANDNRAVMLLVSGKTVKLLHKYGAALSSISNFHFAAGGRSRQQQ